MNVIENKNSYFSLHLPIKTQTDFYSDNLSDSVDLVFSSMGVDDEVYKFKNDQSIIYFFRTNNRKRRGQLNRYCQQYLPVAQEYESKGIEKFVYDAEVNRMIKNTNYTLQHKPNLGSKTYSGRDIKLFDDKNNWRPWQRDLYDLLFYPEGNYRIPPDRLIYTIIDENGNTGKSTFYKYLLVNHLDSMARISYATASQLRSSIVNIGEKSCYIIDLSRSKGKADSDSDLLSLVEDLKTGTVSSFMYGRGKNLLFDPPFVILSSNRDFNYSALSSDRWKLFTINKSYQLVPRSTPKTPKKKNV